MAKMTTSPTSGIVRNAMMALHRWQRPTSGRPAMASALPGPVYSTTSETTLTATCPMPASSAGQACEAANIQQRGTQ